MEFPERLSRSARLQLRRADARGHLSPPCGPSTNGRPSAADRASTVWNAGRLRKLGMPDLSRVVSVCRFPAAWSVRVETGHGLVAAPRRRFRGARFRGQPRPRRRSES
jgi:hypothetical protein